MKRLTIFLILTFGILCARAQENADSAAQPAPVVQSAAEASPEQLWDRANTAYINGDFHTATEVYEQILSRGLTSVKLYYNLANSYFKEGQLGKSVLFYRRALRLAPGNDDIRYNLSVAEARTKDNIEQIPEFFLSEWMRDVRHTMSCTAWSIFSLAALVCALALFLAYLLAQRLPLRKTGFYGTLVAVAVFMLTSWFAMGERREMLDDCTRGRSSRSPTASTTGARSLLPTARRGGSNAKRSKRFRCRSFYRMSSASCRSSRAWDAAQRCVWPSISCAWSGIRWPR